MKQATEKNICDDLGCEIKRLEQLMSRDYKTPGFLSRQLVIELRDGLVKISQLLSCLNTENNSGEILNFTVKLNAFITQLSNAESQNIPGQDPNRFFPLPAQTTEILNPNYLDDMHPSSNRGFRD